jgi:hypothetical protein
MNSAPSVLPRRDLSRRIAARAWSRRLFSNGILNFFMYITSFLTFHAVHFRPLRKEARRVDMLLWTILWTRSVGLTLREWQDLKTQRLQACELRCDLVMHKASEKGRKHIQEIVKEQVPLGGQRQRDSRDGSCQFEATFSGVVRGSARRPF